MSEELIERGREFVRSMEGAGGKHLVSTLCDALEAAEKAHTPTDDEREALHSELSAWQKHTGDTALANMLGRAASAIRRSGVTEPLIECPHWSPGRITLRRGCTACASVTEQGENRHG